MKGFAVLCLIVLCLIPPASFAAELPLTPQILDQIKADIQAYEARLDAEMTTEEMRDAIKGRIFGLQVLTVASAGRRLASVAKSPLDRSPPRI